MEVSESQWIDFKDTAIYQEIKEEFKSWLTDIRMELEDFTGELTDKQLHRLGGNAESMRRASEVVEIIIARIQMDKEANNG